MFGFVVAIVMLLLGCAIVLLALRARKPASSKTSQEPVDVRQKKPTATSAPRAGPRLEQPAAASPTGDWGNLLAYLREGRPADIEGIEDPAVFASVVRYYETVVSDDSCPKLTYYVLKATGSDVRFPHLVVVTGDRSEHDNAWHFNYEPVLKRALPGKSWNDLSRHGYANFSKPGCTLASTAPFDNLAREIAKGGYQLDRVLRPVQVRSEDIPTGATQKKSQRWDVLIFGEEAVRPDLACQFCGDDRVALGNNGSHLRCCRCGAVYCRRNCQASIHGQCPRCGEADRINYVQ